MVKDYFQRNPSVPTIVVTQNPTLKHSVGKNQSVDWSLSRFTTKKYDIIYADPSWDYSGKMQYDKFEKTYLIVSF